MTKEKAPPLERSCGLRYTLHIFLAHPILIPYARGKGEKSKEERGIGERRRRRRKRGICPQEEDAIPRGITGDSVNAAASVDGFLRSSAFPAAVTSSVKGRQDGGMAHTSARFVDLRDEVAFRRLSQPRRKRVIKRNI